MSKLYEGAPQLRLKFKIHLKLWEISPPENINIEIISGIFGF